MDRMYDTFDGSEPELIEVERILFEDDADSYGFDLRRLTCASPEPWSEYYNSDTGHRWGGWLAARSLRQDKEYPLLNLRMVQAAIEEAVLRERDSCAKVAENATKYPQLQTREHYKMSEVIAKKIRERSTTP